MPRHRYSMPQRQSQHSMPHQQEVLNTTSGRANTRCRNHQTLLAHNPVVASLAHRYASRKRHKAMSPKAERRSTCIDSHRDPSAVTVAAMVRLQRMSTQQQPSLCSLSQTHCNSAVAPRYRANVQTCWHGNRASSMRLSMRSRCNHVQHRANLANTAARCHGNYVSHWQAPTYHAQRCSPSSAPCTAYHALCVRDGQ